MAKEFTIEGTAVLGRISGRRNVSCAAAAIATTTPTTAATIAASTTIATTIAAAIATAAIAIVSAHLIGRTNYPAGVR